MEPVIEPTSEMATIKPNRPRAFGLIETLRGLEKA
jgi:hypothetical protein